MRVGEKIICRKSLFDNAGYSFVLLEEYEVIEISNKHNDIVVSVDDRRYHFYINDNTYYEKDIESGTIRYCLRDYFWTNNDIRKKKLEEINGSF